MKDHHKTTMKVGERIFENRSSKTAKIKAAYNAAELLKKCGASFLQMVESKFARMFFKILVVESDKHMAKYIRNILKNVCGFTQVYNVLTVEDAIKLIDKGVKFQLILSGFRLDGKQNGYKLYEKINEIKKVPPFVMVTGASDYEIKNLTSIGIPVIKKPFSIQQITTLVLSYYIKFLEPILTKE